MPPALDRLGTHSVAAFMRETWQKRPLLIRRALPDFVSPVGAAELRQLVGRDDVESRLVTSFNGRWRLAHGPFDAAVLPARTRRRWTLLVNGVDLVLPAAHDLLRRFRFVADARLDDLMASLASDGGGVGPHVDSYDVFLLQAQGRRRWRIGPAGDARLIEGLPLKILADFRPTEEWVLDPGDCLYLPPGIAHEGVALGECLTLSIGFRSPAWQELVEPWFLQRAQRTRRAGRYTDAGALPARHPGRLPQRLIEQTWQRLHRLQPQRRDAVEMLLAVLTEPKAQVVFEAPRRPLSRAAFARAAAAGRLQLAASPRTRFLYAQRHFAINGEVLTEAQFDPLLALLADRRELARATLLDAPPPLLALLHEWYVAGWLECRVERRA